ncbi:MAG: FliH/SctL family protein [Microthrixaceae bacterium]
MTDPFPSIDQLVHRHPRVLGTGAPDRIEQIRSAAEEEGYEHGRQMGHLEGVRDGRAEGRADIRFALTALHGAIGELEARDAVAMQAIGDEVIELALAVAEAVIGRELELAKDPGRDALSRALALAPDRGDVVARLNPDDLGVLREPGELAPTRELSLVADTTVARGDCVVEVGPARVSAQIESALQRVRSELLTYEVVRSDVPDRPDPSVTGSLHEPLHSLDVTQAAP